jgi:hypothetical protein
MQREARMNTYNLTQQQFAKFDASQNHGRGGVFAAKQNKLCLGLLDRVKGYSDEIVIGIATIHRQFLP